MPEKQKEINMLPIKSNQQDCIYFKEVTFNKSENDYIIRGAELTDFEMIVAIVNEAYWSQQQHFFTDSALSRKRVDLKDLHEINADPHQKLFVLVNKTKNVVLGVILFELLKDSSLAKFGLFALDNSCRGKNLGPEMIAFVERCAVQNGRNKMTIEVFAFANKLAEYYKTFGYIPTGKAETFFHKDCIQEKYRNEKELYLQKMIKFLK
jgi:hypothetical protein